MRVAVCALTVVVLGALNGALVPVGAEAHADAPNADLATVAARYVGGWGGEACRDAGISGYNGTTPGGQTKDGQCKAFVVCVVWMVLGKWVGNGPSPSYQDSFPREGAIEVRPDEAAAGDVIIIGYDDASFPLHAAIVVDNLGNDRYTVVDSNFRPGDAVIRHVLQVPPFESHIWRLSRVDGARSPVPGQQGSLLGPIGRASFGPTPATPIEPKPYVGFPAMSPTTTTTTTIPPLTTSSTPETTSTTVPTTTTTTTTIVRTTTTKPRRKVVRTTTKKRVKVRK